MPLSPLEEKAAVVLGPALLAGTLALAAAAILIEEVFDFPWVAVFTSPLFLFASSLVLAYWTAFIVLSRGVPSIRLYFRIGAPILALIIFVLVLAAFPKLQFRYNDFGYYESRGWKTTSLQRTKRQFTWDMIAVEDLSSRPLIVTFSIDESCKAAAFAQIHPIVSGIGNRWPLVEDITDPPPTVSTRRWRIVGFQPPQRITFSAAVCNSADWVGTCFHHNASFEVDHTLSNRWRINSDYTNNLGAEIT